ncbi:MAG: hypothetical protein LKF52_13325 [Butyrivibrio sp.]|jgi:hypothetical protein|nr:hypothetical protein [Butyrivibrio sp.]
MKKNEIMYVRVWHLIFYIVTVLICVFALLSLNSWSMPVWLVMMSDALSGVLFGLSIVLVIGDSAAVMKWLPEHLTEGKLLYRVVADYRVRTMTFAALAVLFGMAFILMNFFYGCRDHFFWYQAVAAYYLLLSTVRIYIISVERRIRKEGNAENNRRIEEKVYQRTGTLLIVITLVMGAVMADTIIGKADSRTTGIMVYGVGLYTFYKMTMSILNLRTAARQKSYMVKAVRNIGFADALMSMFHLQIVLIVRYGNLQNTGSRLLNVGFGGGIFMICLYIGLRMILEIKKIRK